MKPDPKPPKDDTDTSADAVHKPDEQTDQAENVEEKGEPFDGNFA